MLVCMNDKKVSLFVFDLHINCLFHIHCNCSCDTDDDFRALSAITLLSGDVPKTDYNFSQVYFLLCVVLSPRVGRCPNNPMNVVHISTAFFSLLCYFCSIHHLVSYIVVVFCKKMVKYRFAKCQLVVRNR